MKASAEGQVQLSPQVAASLTRQIAPLGVQKPLSERERDVLRLIARGRTNKEIARELRLGCETVKTHVSNILIKLSVQGRTQAALQAVRMGLVRADDVGRR